MNGEISNIQFHPFKLVKKYFPDLFKKLTGRR